MECHYSSHPTWSQEETEGPNFHHKGPPGQDKRQVQWNSDRRAHWWDRACSRDHKTMPLWGHLTAQGHLIAREAPESSLVLGNIFTFGPLNCEMAEPTSIISAIWQDRPAADRPAAISSHPAPLPWANQHAASSGRVDLTALELPVSQQLNKGI